MSVVENNVRTLTCDVCGITATFIMSRQGVAQEIIDANPWMKTGRLVQTTDGRNFFYHDDECELKAVAEGKHNPPEPKRIVTESNPAAVAAAVAAKEQEEKATAAIRSGQPAKIQVAQ